MNTEGSNRAKEIVRWLTFRLKEPCKEEGCLTVHDFYKYIFWFDIKPVFFIIMVTKRHIID
jgi:hypothetical protein